MDVSLESDLPDVTGSSDMLSFDDSSCSLNPSFELSPESKPNRGSPRVVRFDLEDDEDSPSRVKSTTNAKDESLLELWGPHQSFQEHSTADLRVRLDRVFEKLLQTQVDLTTERSLRHRKEKTIFKLAKELTKQTSNSKRKSQKIKELNVSRQDLERKLEAALVVAKAQFVDQKCHRLRQELSNAKTMHGHTTMDLRRRVLELTLEKDALKRQLLAATERGLELDHNKEVSCNGGQNHIKAIVVLVLILLALAWMPPVISNSVVRHCNAARRCI